MLSFIFVTVSMFMLSFNVMVVCDCLLSGSESVQFFHCFVYICIAIGDPIMKSGRDLINWFHPATFLCLSQSRTCISIGIYCDLFCNDLR
jgi:hypothetical protein